MNLNSFPPHKFVGGGEVCIYPPWGGGCLYGFTVKLNRCVDITLFFFHGNLWDRRIDSQYLKIYFGQQRVSFLISIGKLNRLIGCFYQMKFLDELLL